MGTKKELTVLDKSPFRGVVCNCKQPHSLAVSRSPAAGEPFDGGVIQLRIIRFSI